MATKTGVESYGEDGFDKMKKKPSKGDNKFSSGIDKTKKDPHSKKRTYIGDPPYEKTRSQDQRISSPKKKDDYKKPSDSCPHCGGSGKAKKKSPHEAWGERDSRKKQFEQNIYRSKNDHEPKTRWMHG